MTPDTDLVVAARVSPRGEISVPQMQERWARDGYIVNNITGTPLPYSLAVQLERRNGNVLKVDVPPDLTERTVWLCVHINATALTTAWAGMFEWLLDDRVVCEGPFINAIMTRGSDGTEENLMWGPSINVRTVTGSPLLWREQTSNNPYSPDATQVVGYYRQGGTNTSIAATVMPWYTSLRATVARFRFTSAVPTMPSSWGIFSLQVRSNMSKL